MPSPLGRSYGGQGIQDSIFSLQIINARYTHQPAFFFIQRAIIFVYIMANFETSFIPEQGSSYQGGSRRSIVATVFSIIIALTAMGLAFGAWWLQTQEEKKVKNLEAEISNMEERFDIDKIAMLNKLDKRINLAKEMFTRHSMPSVLIDYLSDNTVSSVKWKSISYTRGAAAESTSDTIDLTGEGLGYPSLLQQLSQFRTRANEITRTELKSYSIDPRTNIVSMQMTLSVNPNFATFGTLRSRNMMNPPQDSSVANPNTLPSVIQPATLPATNTVTPTPTRPNTGTSSKPVVTTPTI